MNEIYRLVDRNLLCAITVAFGLGIAMSPVFPNLWLVIACFISCCILILSWYFKNRYEYATVGVLALFVFLGAVRGYGCKSEPFDPAHIYNLVDQKKEAVVIGIISNIEVHDGGLSSADLDCLSVRFDDGKSFVGTRGKINLSLTATWPENIVPGEYVSVRADLERPRNTRTAGSFDYAGFLAEKGIWVAGRIKSPLFVHKADAPATFFHRLKSLVEKARLQISSVIDRSASQDVAGLYKAVMIGNRTGIGASLLERFKNTGCMHILAISGLHLSIIGVFIFSVLYWLLRRSAWLILRFDTKKIAAVASLPPLGMYALLAGSGTPVLRSLLMSTAVVIALCVNRKKSIFSVLALAMLILLVFNPASLFTVSFQLTFAAVASLAAISPVLNRLFREDEKNDDGRFNFPQRLKNWFFAALTASVAATLGTAPLLLYYFNRVSIVGLLANLIVEPLICLISLPIGFLACVFLLVAPAFSEILLRLGSFGLIGAVKSIGLFDMVPGASLWLPTPSIIQITCYYAILFLLLNNAYRKKESGWTIWLIALLVLVSFRFTPAEIFKYFRKGSTLTFIDVGQGSSTLVELPAGKRVLIDGGGPASLKRDVGEKVIGPFLWKKGIARIDAVIVTHPDADHYNGLPFIVHHFKPKILYINGDTGHDAGYADLLKLAERQKVVIEKPMKDQQLLSGGDAEIRKVPNPLLDAISEDGKNVSGSVATNDKSLIVKLINHNFSVLFPGDISKNAENGLVADRINLSADILLSPHHGSTTSNTKEFLAAVHPSFVVVSSDYKKKGIFPSRDLEEKLKGIGAGLLTTADDGCIVVTTDGSAFSVNVGDGISKGRQIADNIPVRRRLIE